MEMIYATVALLAGCVALGVYIYRCIVYYRDTSEPTSVDPAEEHPHVEGVDIADTGPLQIDYSMCDDYIRKTAALAEQRKEWEAKQRTP